MTKPGDSPTTKKTMHELCKEFPDKTYNSVDVLTIVGTNKSVQKHAYESIKDYGKSIELKRQKLLAELEQLKKGKKYIYDKTWGFTHK